MEANELGKVGETIAAEKLVKDGYKILHRNYRFLKAEVDIVAEKDGLIIFVEVKTRVSSYLSDPSLLVPVSKQKQIIKAADDYIKTFYPERESRFDIMIVITNKQYTFVDHIVDAFYPMV